MHAAPTPDSSHRFSFFAVLLALLTAVVFRVLPHPPNLTPVAATALFSGAVLGRTRLGYLLPMAGMLVSDLALQMVFGFGFHRHMPSVYGALLLSVFLGGWLLRDGEQLAVTVPRLLATSVVATGVFFLATNGSVWFLESYYPKTWAGLTLCYTAGLPFLERSLLGNVFFTSLIFGLFSFAQNGWPVLRANRVA